MGVRINEGALHFDATLGTADFEKEFERLCQKTIADYQNLSKSVAREGDKLNDTLKRASIAAAGFFSIQAGSNLVQDIIRTRGEFQQLEVAFSTILGSKEKADKLMSQAVDLAAKTPFTLQEVGAGAKQLLAYGFGADTVTKNLTMLGNVAAGVSAPLGDIVYLYGTLQTQGRAYSKDIMQFTGRGIPIIAELAKQFNVTKEKVSEMVEAGKVGFPEIEKAFQTMTGSGGMFFNLMEEQSKTLTGQISNLQDAFSRMLNDIGASNEGIISNGIAGLTALVNHYEDVIALLKVIVATYGTYRAAVMLATALQITAAEASAGVTLAFKLQYAWTLLADRAQRLLNASMLANPYVATATAIAALGAAFYVYSDGADIATRASQALADISRETSSEFDVEANKLTSLLAIAKNSVLSKQAQAKAMSDINKLSPELLGNLTLETLKTKEATTAIDSYLESLKRQIELKVANEQLEKLIKEKAEGPSLGTSIIGDFTTIFDDKNFDKQFADQNFKAQEKVRKRILELIEKDDKKNSQGNTGKAPARNREYYEGLVKENTAKLEALDKADRDFATKAAPLKKKIREAQQELLAFSPTDKAGIKANKELEDWGERKLQILEKIARAEAEVAAKNKTQSEKEIEDNKIKYSAIRSELEEYNRKAKRAGQPQLGPEVFKRVDNAENKERYAIEYKQQTTLLVEELDRQKDLYGQFEQYRLELGIEKAKARFAGQIEVEKTYRSRLQEELDILDAKKDLTGSEKDRKKILEERMQGEIKTENEKYTSLLASLKSYEQTRKVLVQNYEADRARLIADNRTSEVSVLEKKHRESLARLDDENVQKLQPYRDLFKGIDQLSDQAALKVIANGRKMLNGLMLTGKVSLEQYGEIDQKLRETEKSLENRLPERLAQLGSELSNISSLVGGVNSRFGEWLGSLGSVIGNISQVKGQMDALKKASGAGDILGSLGSGLGLFGTFMNIGKALGELFNRGARERAEQAKYATDLQLKQNEAINKSLDRQLELINKVYGTEKLVKYAEAMKGISAATADVKSQLSGMVALTGNKDIDTIITKFNNGELNGKSIDRSIFNQLWDKGAISPIGNGVNDLAELQKLLDSGKLDSKTAQLAQTLIDLKKKADDAANSIKQELTGTSFESFADGIVNMFADANASAADFGKNFEDIMKKAILNSFKTKAIAGELQNFYDQFAEFSASGSKLTADEIALLKARYDKIITDGKAKFDDLEKVTGVSFSVDTNSGRSSNSLQGAYATASQDSINVLSGHSAGMRIAQIETNKHLLSMGTTFSDQLRIAKSHLDVAVQIEANTRSSARKLEDVEAVLTKINDKLGSGSNSAQAAGFKI